MRVVIQRVNHASVQIDGQLFSSIQKGLLLLVGFTHGDTEKSCEKIANKISTLRIFEDAEGKLNRSLIEVDGALLSVSQFTLYANCRKGRRPSFEAALLPEAASELYHYFNTCLTASGLSVRTGVFQADMKIELENDGPVTIILDSEQL
ncbi:D-aminoacyl-tRNA deacylase [bioreactor metagenome]|uniref:D-aminoacyl-tRNA deacylase n=1 Tax=bioreactor metagenome TaxID=1076179 RepID=A0A644Z5V4_9ZZZZ|nr:D-aminoacyl-tRNA deacylase [Erysipelotrichaceae bacterium]